MKKYLFTISLFFFFFGSVYSQNFKPREIYNLDYKNISNSSDSTLNPEKLKIIKSLYIYNFCDSVFPSNIVSKFNHLSVFSINGRTDRHWNTVCKASLDSKNASTFKNVYSISVGNIILNEFPSIAFMPDSLASLDLYRTYLTKLPERIYKLNKVENLYLGANKLEELPDSFMYLKKLKNLDLSNNDFKKIPTSLVSLERIETINFRNADFAIDSAIANSNEIDFIKEKETLIALLKKPSLKKIFIEVHDCAEKKAIISLIPDSVRHKLAVYNLSHDCFTGKKDTLFFGLYYGFDFENFDNNSVNAKFKELQFPEIKFHKINFAASLPFNYKRFSFGFNFILNNNREDRYSDTLVRSGFEGYSVDFGFELIRLKNFVVRPIVGEGYFISHYNFLINDTTNTLTGFLSNSTFNKNLNYTRQYANFGLSLEYKWQHSFIVLKSGVYLPEGNGTWNYGDKPIINDNNTNMTNKFFIRLCIGSRFPIINRKK